MAEKMTIGEMLEGDATILAEDILHKDQIYVIRRKTDDDVLSMDINATTKLAETTSKDPQIEDSTEEDSDGTEPENALSTGRILVIGELANGGFGKTYRVMHSNHSTGDVKTGAVLKEALDPDYWKYIKEEIEIFQILSADQHKNIIMQLFACKQITTEELYLGLEFFNGETLEDMTKENLRNYKNVSDKDLFHILRQQTEAIGFLQSTAVQIYHCDITPSNIMYLRAMRVSKLIDFGLSVPYDIAGQVVKHVGGTIDYAAPETLADGIIGAYSELYGLAATLFYVVAKRAPPSWCSEEKLQQIKSEFGSLESEDSRKQIKTSSKEEIDRHRRRVAKAKIEGEEVPDTKVQEELDQYLQVHQMSLITIVRMMLNAEAPLRTSPTKILEVLKNLEQKISDDSADEALSCDNSDHGSDSHNDEYRSVPISIRSDGAYATTGDEFSDINAVWEGVPSSH